MTVIIEDLEVPTADGSADSVLARPDDGAAHPGVLLVMDAFGVRPRLRDMAERLAAEGYTVLVPNLFHRDRRAPVLGDGMPDLAVAENREKVFAALGAYMQNLTPERAIADGRDYLDWLAASPYVTDGPVGLTGYCMGGRLALRIAGTYPERISAAASFHGGRLADDSDDSPHLLADRCTAELYIAHADQDHSMPAEQIEKLEQALDAAGAHYRSEVYEGAQHGFTQADTAMYNAEAEDRHWRELLDLFARTRVGNSATSGE